MNQEAILACCVVCRVKTNSRCSRCRNIYYCSTEHQRQDWKRHKIHCVKLPKKHDRKIAVGAVDVDGTNKEVQIVNTVEKSVNQKNSISPQRQEKGVEKSSVTVPNANSLETSDKKVLTKIVENSISNKVFKESATISKKANTSEHDSKDKSNRLSENSVISSVVHTDKDLSGVGAITYEGSSENEILSASTQQISSTDLSNASLEQSYSTAEVNMLAMSGYAVEAPPKAGHGHKEYPEGNLKGSVAQLCQNHNIVMDNNDPYYDLCDRVIRDMTRYGVCVLDNFLGKERGTLVLKEVLEMYKQGIFQAGQLVSNPASTKAKTIRSDRITWIDGKEPHCFYIGNLIQQVDNIILRANKMVDNGKMGDYIINGRTKAMVACYPGSGSHYVKHVDNPNKDGRCITAIYYLNLNWDVSKNGGLLRVFPEGHHQVADIAPVFDRMLFFWSDRRNPHEVQPAFDTRYAITLWYFDAQEREEATRRFRDKYIRTPSTSK